MNRVTYFTLAAARNANPEACDDQIRSAVFSAAEEVGQEAVVSALSAQTSTQAKAELQRAA